MKRLLVAVVLALPLGVMALERTPMGDARQNYTLFCAGCHAETGRGIPHKVPRLNGRLALYLGVEGGRDFILRVPGVANSQLDDARLAAVLNHVVERFAPSAVTVEPFTSAQVHAARQHPLIGVEDVRTRLLRAAGVDEATIAAEY